MLGEDQGFLDHLVQNVGLGEIAVDGVQCGNGTRRMQELYGRAVSTAVASLHPLAMQLNTFEAENREGGREGGTEGGKALYLQRGVHVTVRDSRGQKHPYEPTRSTRFSGFGPNLMGWS